MAGSSTITAIQQDTKLRATREPEAKVQLPEYISAKTHRVGGETYMVLRFNPVNATTKEDMEVPMPTLAQLKEITGGQLLSVEQAAEIMDTKGLNLVFSKILKPGERTTVCSRWVSAQDAWFENHQYGAGPQLEIGYGSALNGTTPVIILRIPGRDTVKSLRREISRLEEMASDMQSQKSYRAQLAQIRGESLLRVPT